MHGTDGSVRHISASRTFVSLLSRIINKRSQFVNRTFKDFFGKRGFKEQVSAFCDTSRRFEKMSLTRGKGLKQHDLTPFFRIPITVIRVDAVLLRDVKGCCCNAGGIGQGGTQIFAVADGCNVDGRKRQNLGQLAAHDFATGAQNTTERRLCATAFLRSAASAEGRSVPSGWVNSFSALISKNTLTARF